jgi:hypothetical protein
MGDSVTLSDGRVLSLDMRLISMREYRAMFDPASTVEDEDVIFARVLGLTPAELNDLPVLDYRLAKLAVTETARKPLQFPNSASVSTSG